MSRLGVDAEHGAFQFDIGLYERLRAADADIVGNYDVARAFAN